MPADPAGRDATAPEVEAVAQAFGYTPSMKRMWPEALEKAAACIAALDEVRAAGSECDGGFNCPATRHIEGCYTGEGHPQAVRAAGRAGEGQTSAEFSGAPEGSNDGAE